MGTFLELDNDFDDFFDNVQLEPTISNQIITPKETIVKKKSISVLEECENIKDTSYNILTRELIVDILYKDYINIITAENEDIVIKPIDNNLFKLYVELNTKFGQVMLEVSVPHYYYPYKPPIITFITNVNSQLIYGILNTDYLKPQNWVQTNTLKYTLNSIKNIINKYQCEIIFESNNSELQNLFIRLSIISDIKPRNYNADIFKIHFIPIEKTIPNAGKILAGYGSPAKNQDTWDINKYIENEKIKEKEIINIINELADKNITKEFFTTSCIIPFINNQLQNIDISNRIRFVESIFKIIDQIYNQDQDLILELKQGLDIIIKLPNSEIYNNINIINVIDKCKAIIYNAKSNANVNNYVTSLIEYQSTEVQFSNENTIKFTSAGLKKINKDLSILMSSLPLHEASSIFMRYDCANLSTFYFLITGPENTPYDSGCFIFKVNLPVDYPHTVPSVNLLTTGAGRVRFNPNLYNSGKVCLSLLGTWTGGKGESWDPNVSTIYQILMSIQSMILVEYPYYNEPGYHVDTNYKTNPKSVAYNNNLYPSTVKFAMIDMIKSPPKYFENMIHIHFKNRRTYILDMVKKWNISTDLYSELENVLNNL